MRKIRHSICKRVPLHLKVEEKDHQSLKKLFPFLATFIHWSTEYKSTALITRVHSCYSEIVAVVMGDMRQRAWRMKELDGLGRMVTKLKSMLA